MILFEIDWFALTTFATKFEVHLALRYNDRAKLLKIKKQRKGIRENIDQAWLVIYSRESNNVIPEFNSDFLA